MINVRIVTTTGQDIRPYTEDTTVREILEDSEITLLSSTITMLDGCNLRPGDIDKTLVELNVTRDSCVLSAVVKTTNAVEATFIGNVVHVISDLKVEDVRMIKKYRPDALSLYETVDSKQIPVFSVGVAKNDSGNITKSGITFSSVSTAEGNAMATMVNEDNLSVDEIKDIIGVPMLQLKKLEESLGGIKDEIAEQKAKIDEMINVI